MYELNPNFSIELKTNFGYGSVSYFYTRIKFRGLDIIPFSDWILFEKAHLYEIIQYTAKYQPKNESWLEALEYSRDACNLSLTNEIGFIRKYVIDECEKMVSGLEQFLEGNKLNFLNWEKVSTDVYMEGHDLIEFRGEKVSGALQFIEHILQFGKVAEIKEFVKRIEICNENVQPMLSKENLIIEQELIKLNETMEVIKPIYEELENRNIEYENLKTRLGKKMFSNDGYLSHDELQNRFKEQNPEYEKFTQLYKVSQEQFYALTKQICSLETTKANIEKYSLAIVKYFEIQCIATSE